ncbi:MarR family winged helix-turn-helix transcriptional regulator [Flavobacterium algicola]|uniref:MarR family winged helix-turn-helix transcriptional regulator n=1 Tax=Flavobacterium algicola TaxID=556529 RepID=UPI001EFDC9D8|nr:MarR family transcriptional regulator [Flavobacterium algicola]MCG9790912.1 MarR family transcriptional regulator [Flavobacterium algicola]
MNIEEITKTTKNLNDTTKIILNILYTEKIISEQFGEILKPYDLSSEQYNVLRILRGQKGKPANMFLIQERMVAKKSNTTRLVDKLLLKSFVTRQVCPENRRKIEVSITQKGLDTLTELEPKVKKHEQSFVDNFSDDELQQLNYLLEKYRNI